MLPQNFIKVHLTDGVLIPADSKNQISELDKELALNQFCKEISNHFFSWTMHHFDLLVLDPAGYEEVANVHMSCSVLT